MRYTYMGLFKKTAQCRKCRAMIVLVNGRWQSQQRRGGDATTCPSDGRNHEPR